MDKIILYYIRLMLRDIADEYLKQFKDKPEQRQVEIVVRGFLQYVYRQTTNEWEV